MTSICYFISDLRLQDVSRLRKRTKHWLHKREYQVDKFLSPKGPIKFSPHSQLLQYPKDDYYSYVLMQFKHYLLCKLCYYSRFICMISPKLQRTSMSISRISHFLDPLLFTGRSIHLRLVTSTL